MFFFYYGYYRFAIQIKSCYDNTPFSSEMHTVLQEFL